MDTATIDILMATYNGERFVREQIESIQAQTFEEWRLLVSDDCSADTTLDIVREIAAKDSRIQIVSEGVRHGSAKANFMSLLGKSEAPYVMFCDQDDVWLPNKVRLTLVKMQELEVANGTEKPFMAFTDMKVVDGQLNVIHKSFERSSNIDPSRTNFNQLLAQSVGAGCTMMVNRKAVELALQIKDTQGVTMHDWWLSLICSAFGAVAFIDQPTSLYRQHGENEVGAKRYRPMERASRFDEMRKSVADSVAQASAFGKVYQSALSKDQRKTIREFSAMGETLGLIAVSHLIRSNCWKKGLRKVGQLLVAARGLS